MDAISRLQQRELITQGNRKGGEIAMAKQTRQDGNVKMPRKEYEKALRKLQVELCHLQAWVTDKGLRAIVLFEGRDAAGKGGTIKAIAERVSPRVFRVIALPAPSDRQKSQMFMQRYVEIFRPPARWSSSTAAGTTALASST